MYVTAQSVRSVAVVWSRAAIGTLLTLLGGQAAAAVPQVTPPPYVEHGRLIRAGETLEALGANLMGDTVSEYSGSLAFTQTDLTLPGNNALPVAVGRHVALGVRQAYNSSGLFGDWDLDIPHLRTLAATSKLNWYGFSNGAYNNARCSQYTRPPTIDATSPDGPVQLSYGSYWDGYSMHIPGGGVQTMVKRDPANGIAPTNGTAYPIVTKEHWQFSCDAQLDNGQGEAFTQCCEL